MKKFCVTGRGKSAIAATPFAFPPDFSPQSQGIRSAKLLEALVLCVSLLSLPAMAEISLIGASYWQDTDNDKSYSHTVNIPAGTDLIVVSQTNRYHRACEEVKINGAMITRAIWHNSHDERSAMWYKVNPPTGNVTIYHKISGDTRSKAGSYWFFSGVDTSNPVIAAKETGVATTVSVSFSSSEVVPGGVIVSAMASKDRSSNTSSLIVTNRAVMTGAGTKTKTHERGYQKDKDRDSTSAGGYITNIDSGGSVGWTGLGKNASMVAISLRPANAAPTDITPGSLNMGDATANGTTIGTLTVSDTVTTTPFTWAEVSGATGAFLLGSPSGFTVPLVVQDTTQIDRGNGTTLSYRVRVTDAEGLSYEKTLTINLSDTTKPVVETPAETILEAGSSCGAMVPDLLADLNASDNVGITSMKQEPIQGTEITLGTIPVTITVKDAAGNTTVCTPNVTVQDKTPPTITLCAADRSVGANASGEAPVPSFTVGVLAVDQCDSSPTITQSPTVGSIVGAGTTEVTITATDDAGNYSTCTANFTVNDTTAPVITQCAGDQIENADAQCEAVMPDFTSAVIATDDCDATPTVTQSPTAGSVMGLGFHEVTITVADDAGNEATCTAGFTVSDITDPAITQCASAQSASANEQCEAIVPDFTSGVIATDSCDATLSITQSPIAGTVVGLGVHEVTITVADDAGNDATCAADFTVSDTTKPSITQHPTSQTLSADSNCEAVVPDFTGQVIATDGCDADLLVTQSPAAGVTVNSGDTQVTIAVEDDAGNKATTTVTLTVEDDAAPVITVDPTSDTLECGTSYSLSDAITGVSATDGCQGDLSGDIAVTVDGIGTFPGGGLSDTGVYTIRYNVSDSEGNAATETVRTVTIADSQAPTITNATPTQTLECPASYSLAAALTGVTASDDCQGDISEDIVVTAINTADSSAVTLPISALGSYEIRYNVSDAAGNDATQATRSLTIEDTTAPSFSIPADVTLECPAQYTQAQALNNVSATDDCEGALTVTVSASQGGTPVTFPLSALGTYTLTYSADDGNGYPITDSSRTVTIDDTNGPVITLNGGAAIGLQVGNSWSDPGATATDDCEGDLNPVDIIIGGDTVDVNTENVYTITYDISDSEGNAATQVTRIVTVANDAPPVISITGANPVTLECGSGPYTDAGATASDAEDGDLTSALTTTGVDAVDTTTPGGYTITYEVTDSFGTTVQEQRIVNVQDNIAPIITLEGGTTTNTLVGQPWSDPGYSATDSCQGDLTTEVSVTGTPNTDTAGTSFQMTYNVTDSAGNTSGDIVRTINVVADSTPPLITLLGNATVEIDCGTDYVDPGATANDNVDGDISGDILITGDTIQADSGPGEYTITYNVSDAAGNAAVEVVRTVTVRDNCPLTVTYTGQVDTTGSTTATIDYGASYTFSVEISGAIGTASYQWERYSDSKAQGWVPIPNADQASYTLDDVQDPDSGQYRCQVSDAVTTSYSPVITLTAGISVPAASALSLSLLSLLSALGGSAALIRRRKK